MEVGDWIGLARRTARVPVGWLIVKEQYEPSNEDDLGIEIESYRFIRRYHSA